MNPESKITRELPADNEAGRQALYRGTIFKLGATHASTQLVDDVTELLASELGCGNNIRSAQQQMKADDFFAAMGRIRKQLFTADHYHQRVREVIEALGFDPHRVAFDPMRLRIVNHLGHNDPRAAAVYYAHRDTWYAHPQSIITWWIPLDDLGVEETFEFYPDHLKIAVDNGSEQFIYQTWVQDGWDLKIGWQDQDAGLTTEWPHAKHHPSSGLGFSCKRADNLLFAGAHLHRTLPQATGRSRFSLDFRIAHLDDIAAGLGAPNVDNRSQGSALVDYIGDVGDSNDGS